MTMRKRLFAPLLGLLALTGCGKGPSVDKLNTDQQIVYQVLKTLASDGDPVCVSRWTFGSPLSQYRVAKRGQLERYYVLDWQRPGPWRPPHMPTQKELREAVRKGRNAHIPEPSAERAEQAELPLAKRTILDGIAFAIAPPATPLYWAFMHQGWMPKGVIARWWMGRDDKLGCDANYVLSGIKRTQHAAFVAVRVHHWGTLYALVGGDNNWHVVGQWGPWLY
jgi:hypothetical protein